MAERRMFTKKITDSDAFIEMSSAAQALYFHLNQGADDDGFNNQVSMAMWKAHASTDDLKILMAKNYIIRFENGVIVIKHWRMHNTLRKDRYTPTNFQDELALLGVKDNGAYTLACQVVDEMVDERLPSGCQVVAKRLPQVSIGKLSKDEVSVVEGSVDTATATATTPVENPLENLGIYIDRIAGLYRDICISLHPLKSITSDTKKALADARKTYSVEDYEMCFTLAEESAFLTGSGDRGWKASFHWLVQPSNMEKVLEGRYKDKPRQAAPSTPSNDDSSFDVDEFFSAALTRTYGAIPKGMKEEIG